MIVGYDSSIFLSPYHVRKLNQKYFKTNREGQKVIT